MIGYLHFYCDTSSGVLYRFDWKTFIAIPNEHSAFFFMVKQAIFWDKNTA
jgi:hypothetical protein